MMNQLTVVSEERFVLWMDWKVKKLGNGYVVNNPVVKASVSEPEQCEECGKHSHYVASLEVGCLCIPCINEEFGDGNEEETEEESSEPASDSEQTSKLFEYVYSNELYVVFKQRGVQVVVGWSINDAKPYIKVGDGTPKAQMVQVAIDAFKRFNNEVHGDIARIVKALTRVRKMPASVRVQQRQRQETKQNNKPKQENVSPAKRKENTTVTRYSGTVDASWLAEFKSVFMYEQDRLPTGYEVRDAWLKREA